MTEKQKKEVCAEALLTKRYLTSLKEEPEKYIGIELEFPIINLLGGKTDTRVSKDLFRYLLKVEDFKIIKEDDDGNPVQLSHDKNKDQIVFELSYNTIEFAFEKSKTIQEVEKRFTHYLNLIQPFLRERKHQIEGRGIHPYWKENDNSPVKIDRYKMLVQFLKLAENENQEKYHRYPDYGTFICGNQVQLDVSKSNYLKIINAMNKVEAAKAYLFANSIFEGENWDNRISRDIFWEASMHGYYPENVGVNPEDYTTDQAYVEYLLQTSLFYAYRGEEILYFKPIRAKEYLKQDKILAYRLDGSSKEIQPKEDDFQNHRSYHFQDLTTRGTIEFRSTCTQPLSRTFTPIAFHVGLYENNRQLDAYLKNNPYFDFQKENPKELRKQYSKKTLSSKEVIKIKHFSKDLLEIAKNGLIKREKGEEWYLESIIEELEER